MRLLAFLCLLLFLRVYGSPFFRWRCRRRGCRQSLQQTMIPVYVLIVLSQSGTEEVAALCVSDEVEIICLRGRKRGAESDFTGIANRPGRQTAMFICVVGRIVMQILTSERAVVFPHLFECINHGWVALQRHAFVEAVFENARHERSLVGLRGFAFDERREGYSGERWPPDTRWGGIRS